MTAQQPHDGSVRKDSGGRMPQSRARKLVPLTIIGVIIAVFVILMIVTNLTSAGDTQGGTGSAPVPASVVTGLVPAG